MACLAPNGPLALSAGALRDELNARARAWGPPYELTTGSSASVIFSESGNDGESRHGNFHPASYRDIVAEPTWARRLRKAHTAYRRALPRADWRWRELDCAASSDALLMNIFCHPGALASLPAKLLLGVEDDASPCFGVRARVPLVGGRFDTTEVDMRLGRLLVEAKLTEAGFQTARPALVLRYRDLEEVFETGSLPRTSVIEIDRQWDEALACKVPVVRGETGNYVSYQLIRGALAAYALGASFCVLCDRRRPDLIEAWYRIQQTVRSAELRTRLQLLTWQELAGALPGELQAFLAAKYGITA